MARTHPARICDYCDQAATHVTRDSGDVLCLACLHDQYTDPASSASALTPLTLRRYGASRTDLAVGARS